MNQKLKYELKEAWRETKRQLDIYRALVRVLMWLHVPKFIIRRILKRSEWYIHEKIQRDSLTWPIKKHLFICYNWTSVKYPYIRNYWNHEPGKPRLQADHAKSIYNWGRSDWMNLQPLTEYENVAEKGIKSIDYRTEAQREWQYQYGLKNGLL